MHNPPTIFLFDVMSTLVYDPFFHEVPAFFGMELPTLLAQKHPTAWYSFERGELSEHSFLAEFFQDQRAFDHQGFCQMMQESYDYLDGMEDLLRQLREQGYSLHAFSNYPVWFRWIEEKLSLSRYLAWSFVSCQTGHRKPDSQAYEYALASLGVPASSCWFVDDRKENCQAAESIGMNAIHYQDTATLNVALRNAKLLSENK